LHRIPRLLVVDFRIVAGDNALLLQLLDSVVDGRPGYVRLLRDVRVGGSASVYLQQMMQNAAVEVVEWVIARDGLFVAESVSHSPSTRSREFAVEDAPDIDSSTPFVSCAEASETVRRRS